MGISLLLLKAILVHRKKPPNNSSHFYDGLLAAVWTSKSRITLEDSGQTSNQGLCSASSSGVQRAHRSTTYLLAQIFRLLGGLGREKGVHFRIVNRNSKKDLPWNVILQNVFFYKQKKTSIKIIFCDPSNIKPILPAPCRLSFPDNPT